MNPAPPDGLSLVFEDHFDTTTLNPEIWLPHYLPAWSSRSATAASYQLQDSCLRLFIPPHQPLWLADDHAPLRVSGIQTGSFSGPVGSMVGQQPYKPGAVVREQQPTFRGWTPDHGYFQMRARCVLSPRSMVAWWLVGFEDAPNRSAEICVAEIFGDAVEPGISAAVGMGLHPFRDPAVVDDFAAVRLAIDVADFHHIAVDWTADRAAFFVDGDLVRSVEHPPTYPMQSMLAVFDFPDRSTGDDSDAVPELVVDYVRGYQ